MSTPERDHQKRSPSIRRARLEDASLLAELGARTFTETFASDNTPEDMAAYLDASFGVELQRAELVDPRATFLIAEIDGAPVGYAKLRHSDAPQSVTGEQPIELVRLYAAQQWLGCGIGAALMRACIREARDRGCDTIWLGVWEHNQRAQAFYRRWNFHEVGTHLFLLGSDEQTDILMERSLDPEVF